ncbi:MAG: pseudouridylate synthase [Prevotella sp.]|nr:pseudouridylate synthase [Prevotella sp.]
MEEIEITSLIPQRPPFVMVDKVKSCDETDAVTEFLIREDNIFLDDGRLSPAGMIENMAQACAARMGCVNLLKNESVKIGYIGDIRNLTIIRQARLGEVVSTHVHIILDVLDMTLASVTTKVGEETIAEARIKIALTNMESTN